MLCLLLGVAFAGQSCENDGKSDAPDTRLSVLPDRAAVNSDTMFAKISEWQSDSSFPQPALRYAHALLEQKDTTAYEAALQHTEQLLYADRNKKGLALLYFTKGRQAYARGAHEQGVHWFQQAKDYAQQGRDTLLLGKTIGMLGFSDYLNGNYEECIRQWQEAGQLLSDQGENQEAAKYYGNMGAAYLDKAYFHSAYRYFDYSQQLLGDSARHDPTYQMANVNKGVALLRMGAREPSAALLRKVVEEAPNDHVRTLAHINLLQVYANLGDREGFYRHLDSFHLYQSSARQYGNRLIRVKARAYIQFKEWEKAEAILDTFKQDFMQADSLMSLPNLADFYLFREGSGKNALSAAALDQAIRFAQSQGNLVAEDYGWRMKAMDAAENGEYEAAYRYNLYADSLYRAHMDSTQVQQLLDLGIAYQTEELKKEKAVLGSSLEKAGYTILGLLLLLLAILVLSTLIYSNWRKTKQLAEQQEALRQRELKQKQLELKEQEREMQQTATLLLNARQLETRLLQLLEKTAGRINEQEAKEWKDIQRAVDQFNQNSVQFSIEQELNRQMKPFLDKLHTKYPELTDSEQLVCALVYLGYSNYDIAQILSRSNKSIENFRYRARKKLQVNADTDFVAFLQQI